MQKYIVQALHWDELWPHQDMAHTGAKVLYQNKVYLVCLLVVKILYIICFF